MILMGPCQLEIFYGSKYLHFVEYLNIFWENQKDGKCETESLSNYINCS